MYNQNFLFSIFTPAMDATNIDSVSLSVIRHRQTFIIIRMIKRWSMHIATEQMAKIDTKQQKIICYWIVQLVQMFVSDVGLEDGYFMKKTDEHLAGTFPVTSKTAHKPSLRLWCK